MYVLDVMEAQKASTDADSDDDYLDDVVVRAAMERLQREFNDNDAVNWVDSERFDDVTATKTDYIKVCYDSVGGYGRAQIIQDAIDTGVVRVTRVRDKEIEFAPTEN